MTPNFARWIAAIILTFVPALIPALAYAQTYQTTAQPLVTSVTTEITPNASATPGLETKHIVKANITTSALAALHNRCDMQITTRLASLNQALTRLDSIRKLTDAQKQQYTTAIQSNITGLTSLKAKCDADTDAATLQADTKSIVTGYRIYLEFIPQTALLTAADRLNDVTDQFTILWTKLQTRIADAQAQGNNVTSLQAALADMQTKIADVKTQTALISSQVGSLQPVNVNTDKLGTKTDFQTARTALQAAQADVKAALVDAKFIVTKLLTIKNVPVNTGTPSATTTTTIVSPTTVMTVSPSVAPTQ